MVRQFPIWALVASLLAVALGLALVLPAPSSDTRELLSWGLNPALSTPKQPPLMAWMGFLVMRFAWPTTFWCVALTQALNAIGLAYVHATLRLWSGAREARLMTVLLAGTIYVLGAPVAFALNADILQFPFWAATLFHALRAFETRATAHWAALAFAFALAFYAKYTVALLVMSLAAASVLTPAYRGVWRDVRLYLSAAAGALLIAPHLLAAPHSGAVDHATGTVLLSASVGYRLKNLSEFGLGFLAYLAPAWIWVAAGWFRGDWRAGFAAEPAAHFTRIVTATALILLIALILGAGFKYPSRYDSPFLFLAWLAAASCVRFAPERMAAAERWMTAATLAFAAAVLMGGMALYGVFTIHPRQQEPLPAAAARLLAEWRSRYSCGPAYVMGDFWSAYGLGVSMLPPRPGVHLIEMDGAPGYDPAVREKEGAIVVYRDRLNQPEVRAAFPALDLSAPERLTLPFANSLSDKAKITYEYVFLPPKGC
jgi:hypothetical protein